MTLTESIARFIAETPREAIPPEAREIARNAILDTIGVTLAGSAEPAATIVLGALVPRGAAAEATVLGTTARSDALHAALVNGTAAHALDYDDTNMAMGHPSAPVLPSAMAVAELVDASGSDLIDAFLIGFEVESKVAWAMGGMAGSHYRRGFHSAGTLGALGAVAAAARLLRLDADRTRAALAIAASLASGLRLNFGTMTKPFHVGHGARNGVSAALLAAKDFSAAESIFDGPLSFFNVCSPDQELDTDMLATLGAPWAAMEPGIGAKKYPCCYGGHRAADAVLRLTRAHRLTLDAVQHVDVRVPDGRVTPEGAVGVMIHPRPATGLQGKFSMPYVVAAAIADGELKLGTFSDERVLRPEIQAFLPLVRPDSWEPGNAGGGPPTEVVIHTRDGRELSAQVAFPRGDPASGELLSWEELSDKYVDCASVVLPEEQVQRSLEAIAGLDSIASVRALTAELSSVPVPGRA